VKNAVRDYLEASGHFYRRIHCGSVSGPGGGRIYLGPQGTADYLVCLSHRPPAWVEIKAVGQPADKKRDEAQAKFAADVREMGHHYKICKSVDDVVRFLQNIASGHD
jgi:hypothetical protein